MALKVISSYTPVNLKVTTAPPTSGGPLQATSNPQQTAPATTLQGSSYNPQPASYNPQANYQVSTNWAEQQAQALQAEADRVALERQVERKRATDAKVLEVKNKQDSIITKLKKGILQTGQRSGREQAIKFFDKNQAEWSPQIMARQRQYEKKGAEYKDWVMQADSEEEYNKRLKIATDWLDQEYKSINADIKDYTQSQLDLQIYGQSPMTGNLAKGARFTKDVIGGVAGQSFNALTWLSSQPQRAVNTVKNFVNPNNLRQYYGGNEVKNGSDITGNGTNVVSTAVDQLRKAYNASSNQRIFGISKADEQARLKKINDAWNALPEGKNIFGGSNKSGFLRNGDIVNTARIKYGDDVVDMLLDPMSWLDGAGSADKATKASKMDRLLEFLGKNQKMRDFVLAGEFGKEWAKTTKIGEVIAKLGAEWKPRGAKASDAVAKLIEDLSKNSNTYRTAKDNAIRAYQEQKSGFNSAKRGFITKQATHVQRLQADAEKFRIQSELLHKDYVRQLEGFSDSEVKAMTRYARNGQWSAGDKFRISKYKRADLEKFVADYQTKAKALAKSEGLQRTAKNYLPEFTGSGYDPTARRTLFGDKYYGQNKQQLQQSLINREFMSNYDGTNQHLKDLWATENSILRNAKKTGRGLSQFEKEQVRLLGEQRSKVAKLTDKFVSNDKAIRDAMDTAKLQSKPAFSISRRGVSTNWTKQGLKNTLADIAGSPMKIWKKSVLKYNPAWYVNNALWNVPASVSATGADVFTEYGKLLTSKKYWYEATKNIPEGVLSKISQEIGKGGLASKIEDTSRLATYLSLKKKGFTDEKAIAQVNRWLFDYGTKNWERPIKGILPFWQWQKNIVRLSVTMPFHSPRSAKFYSEAYKSFYQRPYDALPHDTQTYNDPLTGEQVTYDPRKFYKGKAKIGNKWVGVPSFAVNPETALNFGINPYLSSGLDYLTGTDSRGNTNTNRRASTILADKFPQVNLARSIANRNNMDVSRWFTATGNSKMAQGWDSSKSNYKLGLDNNRKFYNTLKSFVGLPRPVEFNKTEFDLKKRLTDFNNAFFAIDWAKKEDVSYKDAQVEKEQLAKKYGFDLQKDIYDNYWSKYDTATTSNTKRLKSEASKFNSPDSGYWRDYFALDKGTATSPSQRRPYLIGKFDEWKKNHTFSKNPYYKLPNKGQINPFTLKSQEDQSIARRTEGKRKYERKLAYDKAKATGDWSAFEKLGSTRKTGVQVDGKWFKSQESADKYTSGKLWKDYYALTTGEARQKFLKAHPELNSSSTPTNQAEWSALRAKNRAKNMAMFGRVVGYEGKRQGYIDYANKKVRTAFGRKGALRFK